MSLQSELSYMRNQLAAVEQQSQVPFPMQPQIPMLESFSISNMPVASNIETNVDNVDLSCLFIEQASQQLHHQQYVRMGVASGDIGGSGTSSDTRDLHDLSRELLNKHARVPDAEPAPKRTHQ